MVRRTNGRPSWLVTFAAIAALALAVPAAAQSTGMVKGKVSDDKGQPVEGAKITIEMNGGTGRRYETKTDKKGEYMQIGLTSGQWRVSAEKEKLAAQPTMISVRVGSPATLNLTLIPGGGASPEAVAKATELKKLFDEGVTLSTAGKHAEAIEKFKSGTLLSATCFDCFNNIGYSYSQLKEWDNAEAAYKQSIAVKSDDAAAYNGLATVYNAQKKFDLANEASANATKYSAGLSAGAGGNSDALYNQAVILFNQGKAADAKPLLEQAIAANANHADAHYLLGMTLVGIDPTKAVPEFETFLKLSPAGPADKVKMAQDVVAAFKK